MDRLRPTCRSSVESGQSAPPGQKDTSDNPALSVISAAVPSCAEKVHSRPTRLSAHVRMVLGSVGSRNGLQPNPDDFARIHLTLAAVGAAPASIVAPGPRCYNTYASYATTLSLRQEEVCNRCSGERPHAST